MAAVCGKCHKPMEDGGVTVKGRHYHPSCYEALKAAARQRDTKSAGLATDTHKAAFEAYVCQRFNIPALTPMMAKQADNMREQYGYTYENMLLALRYFYEFDRGVDEIEDGRPSIGIIPYVYQSALDFWGMVRDVNTANAKATFVNNIVTVRVMGGSTGFAAPDYSMADL